MLFLYCKGEGKIFNKTYTFQYSQVLLSSFTSITAKVWRTSYNKKYISKICDISCTLALGLYAEKTGTILRKEDGFEDAIRKGMQESRNFYNDFLFTNGLRGSVLLNSSLCVLWKDKKVTELFISFMRDTIELWIWSVDRWPSCWPKRRRVREKEATVEVARPRWVEKSTPLHSPARPPYRPWPWTKAKIKKIKALGSLLRLL